MLAEELPNGRLLRASSIIELRLAPERLTGEIADFIDECWRPRAAAERAGAGGVLSAALETVRFAVAPFPAASLTVALTLSLIFLPRLILAIAARPGLESGIESFADLPRLIPL